MGSNLVIVAIPDENDPVWKISSEKVPHLTLLFLGEANKVTNLDQIMLFVEHAADTSLKRFYLPVDSRGELGADKADVLFFRTNRYDFKAIRDFRSQLLQNSSIKTAYDATAQFQTPERVGAPGQPWIPHLTLGYPATPAKPIDQDFGIYSVNFNKIAVWTEDYDGPDFLLKDYGEEFDEMAIPMDVAMSDLQHFGVRGMRWGVRKSQNLTEGQIKYHTRREAKAGARADKKWKKNLSSTSNAVKVHKEAASQINKQLPGFNSDKRWNDANGVAINLNKNPGKKKEYDEAFFKEIGNPAYSNAAVKVHGETSPGGRYKFEVQDAAKGIVKVTDTKKVKHADEDLRFKITRDVNGYITMLEPVEESMAQSATDIGAEFILEHFGVKGMRWGVRKEGAVSTQTHIDTGILRRKTQIRAKGGAAQPAHEDAIKAAVQKQKLKKSGTDALSNGELKDLASRLELEVRVETLASKKGRKFISRQLETQGQQQLQKGLARGVSGGAARVVKKGGKAAGAAALLA